MGDFQFPKEPITIGIECWKSELESTKRYTPTLNEDGNVIRKSTFVPGKERGS